MERTKPATDIDYDVASFRESASERAHARDMSLEACLDLQIYLSCKVLKGELETQKPAMSDADYIGMSAAVQETFEGSRLLVGETV